MAGPWKVVESTCFLLTLSIHCGQSRMIYRNTSHSHDVDDGGALRTTDVIEDAKDPVVVCAARTNDFSAVGRISYPEVLINEGDAWDLGTSLLTVPKKSTYFFHMNAGAHPGQPVNLTLRGVSMHLSLDRGSESHKGWDTMGRNFIVTLSKGSQIGVENNIGSLLYSQGGRQTSFTAFDIEAYMISGTATVFSVARNTHYTSLDKVVFPIEFVNIGQAFDSDDRSTFRVPRSGTYFFTLSVGVKENMNVRVQIKTTSQNSNPLAELWRSSQAHNGSDVISTSVMAELQEGDEVYTELMSGEGYADGGHQISFGGFLYDPVSWVSMAWSVWIGKVPTPLLDPLTFNGSWVNTNQMFDFESNIVSITQSGIYYVTLSIGALGSKEFDASIIIERNRVEMSIYRTSFEGNAEDTLNQGAILRLFEGNTLRVVLGEGSRYFSDGDRQTVFTGFLIHPE